jgi:uncharacterized protein (DUF1015 family)
VRIKPFQAKYPNFDIIASVDTFFKTVKYDYRQYEKSGFFQKVPNDAMYAYRINSSLGYHLGIITTVMIQDYIEGHILKHEDTLSTKEQAMMNLLLERGAMIKPVLLSYPGHEEVNDYLTEVIQREPLYTIHFEETGEEHTLWKIADGKDIARLTEIFQGIDKCYIADGHHRCSTSARLFKKAAKTHPNLDFSELLCAFFSFDQLIIHDYNRVIDILDEIRPTALMARLAGLFNITPMEGPFRPTQKRELSLFLDDEWYRLEWKKKVLKKYKDRVVLDSTLVNDLILRDILGIKDVSSDKRITYVEGTKKTDGIEIACAKKPGRFGLGLYPVSKEEFIHLSDIGESLPPKSTWFEPRIKNGLVAQDF